MSDEVYERIKKVCDFRVSNWTDDCDTAMSAVFSQYQEIDIYNIYAPRCNLPPSSAALALAVDKAVVANRQVSRERLSVSARCARSVLVSQLLTFFFCSYVVGTFQAKDQDVLRI